MSQKSSHINIAENTHLKGGVINAEGDQANHQMQTGTLTTENIENRSEIKVSSLSGGISTDMSQLATSAIGAALSGLGNLNESDRSQTQSAISQNIDLQITDNEAQKQKTGKTAEETLQSLNRDTVNANQKLEKPDLTKVQERQETAQVIGDLSQSGINHLVGEHLKEANQKRAEAESIAQTDQAKAETLRNEAKVIEAEYGVGSSLQMGIRAATGALQGLATGNSNQAIVGGLSPYANKAIKETTTNADGSINKETNLIAHAVLGAVEAKATGNNALAGATSALTAEASAPYLMQALYGTDKAENLSDSQKQNIANLSQVVAGLSGGLAGDSTGSVVAGAEIGKRAVENNAVNKMQAGTVEGFENFFNKTDSKMGLSIGKDAEKALIRLDDVDWRLKPKTTPPFNTIKDRYIYTEKGGWIDMPHFLFYAGNAYSEKLALENKRLEAENNYDKFGYKYIAYIPIMNLSREDINNKAVNTAIKHGYWQERLDSIYPPDRHSAYSYEDLPSDRFGAEFGAKYFDPTSSKTLGEQVTQYLKKLGATDPKNAPNYNVLPIKDDGTHSGIKNKTTIPLFTKEDK